MGDTPELMHPDWADAARTGLTSFATMGNGLLVLVSDWAAARPPVVWRRADGRSWEQVALAGWIGPLHRGRWGRRYTAGSAEHVTARIVGVELGVLLAPPLSPWAGPLGVAPPEVLYWRRGASLEGAVSWLDGGDVVVAVGGVVDKGYV